MESNRFSEFDSAVRARQSEVESAQTLDATRRQQEIAEKRNLEIARERLRQKCRDAAEYLKSRDIPTTRGKIRLALDGGGVALGTYVKPTKFKEVTFPEGWVIGKNNKGEAAQVLTVEGEWVMVVTSNNALGRIGDIVEFPYHRCDSYAVDDQGPYLTFNTDQYGEFPPGSHEVQLTNMVARVVAG